MTTAWDTYRRRSRALRHVVTEMERSAPVDVPWDDELGAVFTDRQDLLVALHDLWTRRLMARIDLALEIDAQSPEDSVALAWREVAAELRGVRLMLDRYEDDPALRRHELHEHRLLAVAAGLAVLDDPPESSAVEGARFQRRIRAAGDPVARGGPLTERMADLVRMLPLRIVGARMSA